MSVAPSAPYGRQRYDAFGRQLQTFDLDGTVTLQSVYHTLSTDLFDAADILQAHTRARRPRNVATDTAAPRSRSNASARTARSSGARPARPISQPGSPEVIERVRAGTNDKVVRWMRYDTLGRMVLNVEPHTTVGFRANPAANPDVGQGIKAWRYAYDDQAELRATSDARGCGSSFFYDGAGRLAGEDYAPCVTGQHEAYSAPNASTLTGLEVIYLYDAAPATPVTGLEAPGGFATGFSLGRPVAVFDGSAVWSRYDARGRKLEEAVRITRPSMTGALAGRYAQVVLQDRRIRHHNREVKASTGATVANLLGMNNESAVETTYTNRGAVGSVAGSYGSLVNNVHRTADGLIESIEYGDIAKTSTDFFFDNRRRLKNVRPTAARRPVVSLARGHPARAALGLAADLPAPAAGRGFRIRLSRRPRRNPRLAHRRRVARWREARHAQGPVRRPEPRAARGLPVRGRRRHLDLAVRCGEQRAPPHSRIRAARRRARIRRLLCARSGKRSNTTGSATRPRPTMTLAASTTARSVRSPTT